MKVFISDATYTTFYEPIQYWYNLFYFETGQYFALEVHNLFSLLLIISHHTASQQSVITKAL